MNGRNLHCEVCGRSDRGLTIVSPFRGPTTIRCELCQGLIDANLIRPEVIDGVTRYRQWHPDWRPGALLPVPATSPESHSEAGT